MGTNDSTHTKLISRVLFLQPRMTRNSFFFISVKRKSSILVKFNIQESKITYLMLQFRGDLNNKRAKTSSNDCSLRVAKNFEIVMLIVFNVCSDRAMIMCLSRNCEVLNENEFIAN